MKRILCATLFGGLLLSAPLAAVRAQDQGAPAYDQQAGWDVNKSISPEDLRQRLALTADQTEKMRAAIANRQDAVQPLYDQLRSGMERLNSQVRSRASDADIQATLDQLDETHRAIQDANDRFLTETAAFLTPTQQAKLRLELRSSLPNRPAYRPGVRQQETTPEKPYQRPMGRPDRQMQLPGSLPGTEPQPEPGSTP